jgi:hypothetical protein
MGSYMLAIVKSQNRLLGLSENAREVAKYGIATPERMEDYEKDSEDPNSYLIGRKKKEYYD